METREFADQFDRLFAVLRDQADRLDDRAQRLGGFSAQVVRVHRLGQVLDLTAIDFGKPRMQQDGLVSLIFGLLDQDRPTARACACPKLSRCRSSTRPKVDDQ